MGVASEEDEGKLAEEDSDEASDEDSERPAKHNDQLFKHRVAHPRPPK
jgi:hypothetical protein